MEATDPTDKAPFAGRRLLAIFPHPDDESYAAGGLLAWCAAGGATVRVVSLSRGEHGVNRQPEVDPSRTLAEIRTDELHAACRALGLATPVLLDRPDGALAGVDPEELLATIDGILDEYRPDLVVTLGEDGVYGHQDHLTCTGVVTQSVCHHAVEARMRALHVVFPRGLFLPLFRALSEQPGIIAPEVSAEDIGTSGDDVDIRLDIRRYSDRKLQAIAAHRSQLMDGDPRTFLGRGVVERLLDEEWFRLAGGPALPANATDPFAGL